MGVLYGYNEGEGSIRMWHLGYGISKDDRIVSALISELNRYSRTPTTRTPQG